MDIMYPVRELTYLSSDAVIKMDCFCDNVIWKVEGSSDSKLTLRKTKHMEARLSLHFSYMIKLDSR